MSDLNFQKIRYELIRGGVSPKFVKRTLGELEAHFSDLESQAIRENLSRSKAKERARKSIGDENTIVKEILGKPELKSLVWRYPGTVFVLGPLFGVIAATAAFILFLVLLFFFFPEMTEMEPGLSPTLLVILLLEALTAFICYLVTPLLAISTILLAKHRMVRLHLPIIGIVLLTVIGSGWTYELIWPTESIPGTMKFSWGYSFLPMYISIEHDLQNYFQILFTLILTVIAWWIYKPVEPEKLKPAS